MLSLKVKLTCPLYMDRVSTSVGKTLILTPRTILDLSYIVVNSFSLPFSLCDTFGTYLGSDFLRRQDLGWIKEKTKQTVTNPVRKTLKVSHPHGTRSH